MSRLKVFIPAAGFGERLKPITDYIPKPLLPILGKPVLEFVLEKVFMLPVDTVGINLHHKKEIVQDWVHSSPYDEAIELFPEDQPLGTGGALRNARNLLQHGPFLVHNADIVSDIDLGKLIAVHLSSSNAVTLAVHDYAALNCLLIDKHGSLCKIVKNTGLQFTQSTKSVEEGMLRAFTGIAVYSPEFLDVLPEGRSSVVDGWMTALSRGYAIGTLDVSGCYWSDIGSPASYARTVFDALRKNGESVFIHPSATWCREVDFDGYLVIESREIPPQLEELNKPITLRNCIILPDPECRLTQHNDRGTLHDSFKKSAPSPDSFRNEQTSACYEDCIVSAGFHIDLFESDLFAHHQEHGGRLIGSGGSDREYYRMKREQGPAVRMVCSAKDADFNRHIEYTRFFKKYGVPVPELIESDPHTMSAVFEDLGDLTLYSWLECPRESEAIERMYRKIIDIMVVIHTTVTDHVAECPMLGGRVFDYEYLRWETGYFLERFVQGVKKLTGLHAAGLQKDFHELAHTVTLFHKTVIHRDFQSQNIMILKGFLPRILDYQGARIGPPAYDLVALLWDPYYRMADGSRKTLLDYYCMNMRDRASWFEEDAFRQGLIPCRLQRHMQALGAYGFLSSVKGKHFYLKHVFEGLQLLREDIASSGKAYPALHDLISSIL